MKKPLYCLAVVASMLFITAPLFASNADDSIESSVQKTYVFKTYLKGDNIKIKSKDGLVTLTETVQEASHKLLAGETVASLPGVKSVENKLEEKSDRPAEKSDAWLITKVETENGVVTLEGIAKTSAEKDLAGKYARDVNGVNKINNNMTIE